MPAGRPSKYSWALVEELCKEIALGKSLKTVTAPEGMPSISMVYRWLREHDEFRELYESSKEDAADLLAEEILEIADDESGDTQRARLRVDARKWVAAKLKPKRFGDFQRNEITGKDGGPVQFQSMTDEELDKRLEQLIGQISTKDKENDT